MTIITSYSGHAHCSDPISLAEDIYTKIKCMLTRIKISRVDYDVLLVAKHHFQSNKHRGAAKVVINFQSDVEPPIIHHNRD